MLEGISRLIIKQFITRKTQQSSMTGTQSGEVKEITPSEFDTRFSLEDLRIPGLDKKQAEHIGYLVKKLLKEEVKADSKNKEQANKKKIISQEIEKHMNRYMTDKEKELVGILINKLV